MLRRKEEAELEAKRLAQEEEERILAAEKRREEEVPKEAFDYYLDLGTYRERKT